MDTSIAPVIHVDQDSIKPLTGKTIVVTGASSGIGLEIAEFFYEKGCNVAFVGGRKRPETYVDLDSDPRALVCQCDVSSWDSQVEVFEAAKKKFGQIDIVCLNAGIGEPPNQFLNVKADDTGKPIPLDLRVLDVDLKGTAYGLGLGLYYMDKGGSIIIVSSRSGYGGNELLPAYSASKNGATGLLRSLAEPSKAKGVSLSLIAPGMVYTPGAFGQQYKRGKEAFQTMRDQLLPRGINLSSSHTCALACGYLVQGGLETAGMGLLIADDEIYNIEKSMNETEPVWFKEKGANKAARDEYKKKLEREEAAKKQAGQT